MKKKKNEDKKITSMINQKKKLAEMKNVLADQEKNLNTAMEIYNLNFFKCV